MKDLINSCRIFDYNFGFLGEIYVGPELLSGLNDDIVEKYFSIKKPYYCSRNMHYYETNIEMITPLQYRHYGYFDEEINYIKMCDELSLKYVDGFYEMEFVYNEIDFEGYLLKTEINDKANY